MNVNFLLNNNSFNNTGECLTTIYKLITQLDNISQLIDLKNKRKKYLFKNKTVKDKIYRDPEILNQKIYQDILLMDFLYNPDIGIDIDIDIDIDRNHKNLLLLLIGKSTQPTVDDMINKEIGFFKINDELIYNEYDLIEFYHQNFENLNNGSEFFNGIKIHFEDLHLSDHVEESLIEIQDDLMPFAEQIVITLIYLNDHIKESFEKHHNIKATLKELTSTIDLHSSEQGKSKDMLNFSFKIDEESNKIKCCDPHVKYNRSEESGQDKEYYRLYFHMGDPDIEEGKVLIGHIGIHLGKARKKK